MEYGKLIVNVLTAGGSFAVSDASITVYNQIKNENGLSSVITTVLSGVSGASPVIELPAPPREESQSYNADKSNKPYAGYIVEIIKEGYYTVTNNNVVIFSGVTSLQNVDMIPLSSAVTDYPPKGINFESESQYEL